jgi:hypothetical protein
MLTYQALVEAGVGRQPGTTRRLAGSATHTADEGTAQGMQAEQASRPLVTLRTKRTRRQIGLATRRIYRRLGEGQPSGESHEERMISHRMRLTLKPGIYLLEVVVPLDVVGLSPVVEIGRDPVSGHTGKQDGSARRHR